MSLDFLCNVSVKYPHLYKAPTLYNYYFSGRYEINLSEMKNIEIENMTAKQFDVLMNSIIQIVKDYVLI